MNEKAPRAWYEDKMWPVACVDWLAKIVILIDKNDNLATVTDFRVKLLWPTGLCDKKGKEGYHKDVWRNGTRPQNTICSIEWENGRFFLQPIGNRINQKWFIQLLPYGEIVGNVFQNPELLEK